MIVIPTVRHTGSLFVVDHLFGGRENVVFRHFGEQYFPEIYDYVDGDIIVPLRRLEKIVESWSGRQLNPERLDRDIELLIEFCERYDPHFLPIDHENRQDFLDKINEDFGLNLKTDWPRINTKSHHHCGDDFTIVDRHKWFFDKVYRA